MFGQIFMVSFLSKKKKEKEKEKARLEYKADLYYMTYELCQKSSECKEILMQIRCQLHAI